MAPALLGTRSGDLGWRVARTRRAPAPWRDSRALRDLHALRSTRTLGPPWPASRERACGPEHGATCLACLRSERGAGGSWFGSPPGCRPHCCKGPDGERRWRRDRSCSADDVAASCGESQGAHVAGCCLAIRIRYSHSATVWRAAGDRTDRRAAGGARRWAPPGRGSCRLQRCGQVACDERVHLEHGLLDLGEVDPRLLAYRAQTLGEEPLLSLL